MIKELLGSAALLIATGANAGLIAEYDFDDSVLLKGLRTAGYSKFMCFYCIIEHPHNQL